MTKTLTQDDFKYAPDWVKSAAVDEDSYLWGYAVGTLFLSIDDNVVDFLPLLKQGEEVKAS